jgi:hypothetical protein
MTSSKAMQATFQKRARILNRTGFALVAIGTVLQMIGVYA